MSDVEVADTIDEQEGEVPSTAQAGRKYTPLTQAEKEAATYRRDASLLEKYGNPEKAAELRAKADALAPERSKPTRVDPMAVLTDEEQKSLRQYFSCTKEGLVKIAAHISAKKLAEIAAG